MINFLKCKKLGLFAGGVLFGTAGVKILSSRDARMVYTGVVAAGLRARDCVLTTTSKVQENAGVITPATSAMLHNVSTIGISLNSMTNMMD